MNILVRYIMRCGEEFDIAFNVLTGGRLGNTFSYRAAVGERDGKKFWCVMCRILNWIVQRNHCRDQFINGRSPALVYIRAGIAFAVFYSAIFLALKSIWRMIIHY
jgi:hypothetical protein